jgi:Flp pilus assembly protein TadG
MIRIGRKMGREDGAVAVELAIVAPVLILILFAIIEFGIALSRYEVYVGAAREGARYAAVRCQPDSTSGCTSGMIATRVQNAAVGYSIGPGSPAANLTCGSSTVGQPVTVQWQQNITISVPFWQIITLTPTVKAVFRCE